MFKPLMWFCAALCCACFSSFAQDTRQAEWDAAVAEVERTLQPGPVAVPVAGQATLNLGDTFGFVPVASATRLMKAMGNRPGDDLAGLILPREDGADWFMVVRYIPAGYIKDDEARDWNAGELLKSIREGTEETNAERASRGLPQLEVVGWVEAPHYDAQTHRLVWSLASRHKGEASAGENGINYNTLALGREGYVSMNLVTSSSQIDAQKPMAWALLGALEFNSGKRYADFNSQTDKVAEYGLTALVAGVAAKKLGLFAVIAAFAAKFAKVIGVAFLALGGGAMKYFRRKKDTPE